MRFRHKMTGKNTIKRVFSFLLMLCLLVPMLPSSIGLEAKADDTTDTTTGDGDTVTITLHDLYIDRKEALPDDTDLVELETEAQGQDVTQDKACLLAYKYARSITVTKGTTLAKALTGENDLQLGTSSLAETKVYKTGTEDKNAMTSNAKASECVWYTRGVDEESHSGGIDGNNPREKFDSDAEINEDIDLYTYSYRLRLVTGEKQYSDLIVREGQNKGFIYGSEKGRDKTYAISDFLNTNSVNTTWTDVNLGTTLTDPTQFNNGITQNYILRKDAQSANTTTLTYYAAVDGEWQIVKTDNSFDLDRVDVWGRTGPALNYYVTDDELAAVYGAQYGFKKSMFEGGEITKQKNGYFPYSNGTGTNLYIRQMPKYEMIGENQTQFRVPLIEDTPSTQINEGGLAIYYTPHNTMEYDSRFLDGTKDRNGWASPTDSAVLRDNSFYTVSVDDADKAQFDNSTTLPNKDKYYLYGSSFEFTLPLKDQSGNTVKWYVEKGGDNVTIDEATGKVTVKAIDKQLVLTTDASKEYADDVQVHCFVLVNGEPKEIGKLHTHATQQYDAWGDDNNKKNRTRYYVTAEQAETVFGKYGFDASKFDPDTNDSQKYIFANAISEKIDRHNNPAKIWADTAAHNFDDKQGVKIPIVNTQDNYRDVALYYVPNNAKDAGYVIADYSGTDSQGTYSFSKDTEFLSANSMFSVTATDEAGQFPDETLPDAKYVWSGNKATVTLPYSENATWTAWYCSTDGKLTPLKKVLLDAEKTISNDRKTITFTFSSISDPILITTGEHTEQEDVYPVTAFVDINGEWQQVKTDLTGLNKKHKTSDGQYYITAEELEYIYGEYGFRSSEKVTDDNRIIGLSNGGEEKVWADTLSVDNGDSWYYPTLKDKQTLYLYYLPNNKKGADSFWGPGDGNAGGKSKADKTMLGENAFYSIGVEDQSSKFSPDDIPETRYVLSGEKATVTLPYSKDVTWTAWYCSVDGTLTPFEKALVGTKEEVNTKNNTITFTFSKVSDPILITTSDTYKETVKRFTLTAYVALNGTWTKVDTKLSGIRKEHTVVTKDSNNKVTKYYITSEELEYIYGKYGFKSSDWNLEDSGGSTRIFGCESDGGTNAIWADNVPIKKDNGWWLPLVPNNKKSAEVYYLPNNTKTDNFADKNTRAQAAKDNAIYEINISDEANRFDGYTDTQYALTGTDKTITLPYKEGVNWYIDSEGSTKKITPTTVSDDKKTATYTLENVTKSIKLTTDGLADDEVAVSGYISVNGEWERVSSTLQKINTTQVDSGRYYLTSAQLESLFGSYGFKASDYADKSAEELSKYFPSSTIGAETISTNAGGKNENGSWWVNTIEVSEENRVAGIAVYYVPNITHVTEDSFAKTNTDVLTDNQFYIISFEDSTGLAKVPSTMYLRGGQVTITVPYANGVTWTVLGKQKNDSNSKDAALYVKQKVSDKGDSAELTFNLHSNVTVTTETVTDRNEIGLEAYVSLNGTWTLLKDTGISRANWDEKTTKYYITEQELLDIYQAYGFTGLKDGEYHIGVTTLYSKNATKLDGQTLQASKMWADQTLATDAAGNRFLPLIKSDYDNYCKDNDNDKGKPNVIRLYYVPNNAKKTPDAGVLTADNADPAKENAFYSITFKDPEDKFQPSELPEDQLLLSGKSTELTLPYKEGVTWIVTDKDGSLIRLDQTVNEETVTIKIPAINQPLIVTTGKATSETLAPGKIAVNAYIAIDDAWVSVGTAWKYTDNKFVGDANSFTVADTQTTEYKTKDSKGEETVQNRYYLTVDQLQNIFGTYGFKADSFIDGNHQNIFPHTTINFPAADIYADIPTKQIGGKWCVLFTNKATDGDKGISIYYTPTRSDNRSFWGPNNTNLLRDNSVYYTVSASDKMNMLPDGQTVEFPEAVQVKRTESTTYTLPQLPDGYHWIPVNKNTGKPLTKATVEQSKDNLKYTISDILEPVQFIVWRDGEKRLTYDARVTPEKLTDTSTFAQPEKQEIVIDGSIEKEATKSISYKNQFNGNDTILPTDSKRAQVTLVESSHPRTFYYTFQGWQVDGTDITLQPGDSLSTLKNYDSYELISLTAVWKAVDTNSRPATVNFYVNLTCEILDNTGTVKPQNKDNFTESVYATRIYGTDDMDKTSHWEDGNSMFSITASETSENAYDIDSTLRQMANVPIYTKDIQGKDNTAVPLTLESFPTDEEVLANLRDTAGWNKKKEIELDGKKIDKDDLTTDNFAVRWYVLKYQSADAWHIDGVLVAKEAHAVVTKTFAGNAAAIKAVKENDYSISVTHEQPVEAISETGETEAATQDVTTDYTLVLKSKAEVEKEPDSEQRGYDSYDPATDTYTWILTGRQGRAYRVKENNYEAPTNEKDDAGKAKYDGTYRYMIRNCTYADEDENIDNDVWKSYGGDIAQTGIDLVAEAYPTDVPSSAYQTIAFENRYVSAGDFTIQKIDSATQNGLKNVNFALSRIVDGKEDMNFTLYREGRTSRYYVEVTSESTGETSSDDDLPKGIDNDNYDQMVNKVVMTDELGYFYIHLPTGTYQLKETAPLGYKGASTITLTVNADGKMSEVTTDPVDDNKWFTLDKNGAILTIKNESRLLTTVTALKQWNENTRTDYQKPVIVELWRNGAKMSGAQYTKKLDESNNWQFEWENLPLFIDGAVAKYELREIYIGSTAYDADADSDGYADYNVSYDDAKYCDGDTRPGTTGNVDTSGFTQSKATWQNGDNTATHYATHALLVVNNSLAKGYISFRKLDGIGQPLAGAKFTLYTDQSCSTAVATATSHEDGTVQFTSQRAGIYYMKETEAPTGYEIDPTVYTVTVSDIGNVKITKPSAGRADDNAVDTVMSITNVSDRTLTLKKVSSTSGAQPLAGATFTIKRNDTDLGTLFTTGSDGTTDFGGLTLDDGHYTITETQAPSGYTKLIDHIDLIVKNGEVKLGQHGTEAELTKSGNSYTLTVENKLESGGVLPSTGNFNPSAALAALLGAALMCGASALALWLRKKRRQNLP